MVILGVGGLAWFQRSWGWGLLSVGLWCWYALFLVETTCDVEKKTKPGERCGNTAYGRLHACHLVEHRRAKRGALWSR